TTMIEDATKTLRTTHSKLAQLLLSAGRLDEAKTAIDKAKMVSVSVADMPTKEPKTEPKIPLPMKLVVSVTKKQIDDFKANRLTLEEVRKAVDIEAVGFHEPKSKK